MAEQQDKDQRTEAATPQRIRKAREDGQIGFSTEFVGGVLLLVASLLAWLAGKTFLGRVASATALRLSDFEQEVVDPRYIVSSVTADLQNVGGVSLAFIFPVAIAAGVAGLLQTGFNLSFKPLNLDWNKLNVVTGFGRMFSSKGVVRGGLSVAKAIAIFVVIVVCIQSNMEAISLASYQGFAALMEQTWGLLIQSTLSVAVLMIVVGAIDLAYQKWKHLEDLKMSIREIKDENKDTDGDPMIKARIRKLQAEMSRKRMLSEVPKANVVITNPTHFAVALRYDSLTMDSPVVVAKGADFLAKRIIETAKENGVAVVERKPIARFLYANVEIGKQIPFEMYQAVAEILNFVNRMKSSV